jgi:hypothetical protein
MVIIEFFQSDFTAIAKRIRIDYKAMLFLPSGFTAIAEALGSDLILIAE